MRPQRVPAAPDPHPGVGPGVSVVIPATNDADHLRLVLAELPDEVDELVLVDGRATDDEVVVAQEAYPEVRIVAPRGPGSRGALAAGFAACRGDNIVTLVADGSSDPEKILAFAAAALRAAADVAAR